MDFLICAKKKLRVFSKILMLNMNPNVPKENTQNKQFFKKSLQKELIKK